MPKCSLLPCLPFLSKPRPSTTPVALSTTTPPTFHSLPTDILLLLLTFSPLTLSHTNKYLYESLFPRVCVDWFVRRYGLQYVLFNPIYRFGFCNEEVVGRLIMRGAKLPARSDTDGYSFWEVVFERDWVKILELVHSRSNDERPGVSVLLDGCDLFPILMHRNSSKCLLFLLKNRLLKIRIQNTRLCIPLNAFWALKLIILHGENDVEIYTEDIITYIISNDGYELITTILKQHKYTLPNRVKHHIIRSFISTSQFSTDSMAMGGKLLVLADLPKPLPEAYITTCIEFNNPNMLHYLLRQTPHIISDRWSILRVITKTIETCNISLFKPLFTYGARNDFFTDETDISVLCKLVKRIVWFGFWEAFIFVLDDEGIRKRYEECILPTLSISNLFDENFVMERIRHGNGCGDVEGDLERLLRMLEVLMEGGVPGKERHELGMRFFLRLCFVLLGLTEDEEGSDEEGDGKVVQRRLGWGLLLRSRSPSPSNLCVDDSNETVVGDNDDMSLDTTLEKEKNEKESNQPLLSKTFFHHPEHVLSRMFWKLVHEGDVDLSHNNGYFVEYLRRYRWYEFADWLESLRHEIDGMNVL